MSLTRFNLTTCIIVGDSRRIQDGKKPVRHIYGLCKELEKIDDTKYDADKMASRMYRANREGLRMSANDEDLVKNITSILMVEEVELIRPRY